MAVSQRLRTQLVVATAVVALLGSVLPCQSVGWVAGFGSPSPRSIPRRTSMRSKKEDKDSPPFQHSELQAAAVAVALGFLAAVPVAMATAGGKGWEILNVMPAEPPVPDENPFVRQLQAKSWQMQPVLRQRKFLHAMKNRLFQKGDLSLIQPKYFVHWGEDSFKYDIIEQKNFNEAQKLGKIRVDADMTEPTEELPVFVYTKAEDQQWMAENLGVYDLVEIPEELQAAIAKIRATKFPAYGNPKANVPAPVSTTPPKELLVANTVSTPAKETLAVMTPTTKEAETLVGNMPVAETLAVTSSATEMLPEKV